MGIHHRTIRQNAIRVALDRWSRETQELAEGIEPLELSAEDGLTPASSIIIERQDRARFVQVSPVSTR